MDWIYSKIKAKQLLNQIVSKLNCLNLKLMYLESKIEEGMYVDISIYKWIVR